MARGQGERALPGCLASAAIPAILTVSAALWLGTTAGIAQNGDLERLVSGVPAAVPAGYAAALILGLLGTPLARTWWSRVWPPETAADYTGRTGYWAACGVRFLAFALLFLPLTAVVAAPWSLGGQLWELVRGPLRTLRRIAGWAVMPRKPAQQAPAPAMAAPPQPPPPRPARAKPPRRGERSKPARSWIANLPKDEDIE